MPYPHFGSDDGTQSVNVVSPTVTTVGSNDLLIGFTKVSAGATFQPGAALHSKLGPVELPRRGSGSAAPGNACGKHRNDSQTWCPGVAGYQQPDQATFCVLHRQSGNNQPILGGAPAVRTRASHKLAPRRYTSYNDRPDRVWLQATRRAPRYRDLSAFQRRRPNDPPAIHPTNLTATSPSNTAIDLSGRAST
jgi:hypothetical protein